MKYLFGFLLLLFLRPCWAHPDAQDIDRETMRQCIVASFAAYERNPRLTDESPWGSAPKTFKTFKGNTGDIIGNTYYDVYGVFIGQGSSITISFSGTNFLQPNNVFTDANVVGHNLQNEDYQDGRFQHHIIGGTSGTGVGYCHTGFYKAYTSCSSEVRQLIGDYAAQNSLTLPQLQVTLTGHSLGGALAVLGGADLVNALYNRNNQNNNIRVISFAAPRVFNRIAATLYDDALVLTRNHLRVVIGEDIVPTVPGSLIVRADVIGTIGATVGGFLRRWVLWREEPFIVPEKIHTGATGHELRLSKPRSFGNAHFLKTYEQALKLMGKMGTSAEEIARGHEDVYERFLRGVLIYRPNPKSDDGKIEMRIADLANPLAGTFDLSRCGDTDQYLSIATGYRQEQNPANADKMEIWFTPRFLVDRELATMAANHHIRAITMGGNWDAARAPLGIFWTWGGWNAAEDMQYCDYLISDSLDTMVSANLLKKYLRRSPMSRDDMWSIYERTQCSKISHFVFELK